MNTAVPKLFISHISEEGELAGLLKQHLTNAFRGSVSVFVSSDLESITAGEDWLKSIDNALNVASVELILCSRLSITRPWVNFEVGAAWLKRIPIVPICHSGMQMCDLPVPYSILNGVEAGQERDLRKLYGDIARTAGVDLPDADFGQLATAVQAFESIYTADVRMRGQGGARIDLKQGERLLGTWHGTGCDLEIPGHIEYKGKLSYELTLKLRRRQNTIGGEFDVHTFERERTDTAFIELINISGDYFYFKYWVALPHANHCGFMVMELSTLGDELEGMFLTNKVFERQIGLGKIAFHRQSKARDEA